MPGMEFADSSTLFLYAARNANQAFNRALKALKAFVLFLSCVQRLTGTIV